MTCIAGGAAERGVGGGWGAGTSSSRATRDVTIKAALPRRLRLCLGREGAHCCAGALIFLVGKKEGKTLPP